MKHDIAEEAGFFFFSFFLSPDSPERFTPTAGRDVPTAVQAGGGRGGRGGLGGRSGRGSMAAWWQSRLLN